MREARIELRWIETPRAGGAGGTGGTDSSREMLSTVKKQKKTQAVAHRQEHKAVDAEEAGTKQVWRMGWDRRYRRDCLGQTKPRQVIWTDITYGSWGKTSELGGLTNEMLMVSSVKNGAGGTGGTGRAETTRPRIT